MPWVTGWQRIDVVRVAALDGDTVVSVLLDAREAPTLQADPLALTAARASGTATIRFDEHPAPADRLMSTVPHADWLAGDTAGLAGNGALALGVAARAAAAAGSAALAAEVETTLEALATAAVDDIPAARAACSALAVRAAAAAAVVEGARSVLAGSTRGPPHPRGAVPPRVRQPARHPAAPALRLRRLARRRPGVSAPLATVGR